MLRHNSHTRQAALMSALTLQSHTLSPPPRLSLLVHLAPHSNAPPHSSLCRQTPLIPHPISNTFSIIIALRRHNR